MLIWESPLTSARSELQQYSYAPMSGDSPQYSISSMIIPASIQEGQYVLRVDYSPSRLFRKEGNRYIKISDDMRGTYVSSNKQLDSFINNPADGQGADGKEQQYLSKVIKPKTD